MVDYHCHILPGIDDGADSLKTAQKMVAMLQEQGVHQVVATPHFYAHLGQSVSQFLHQRQAAYETLAPSLPFPMALGAEIALEHGISNLPDIQQLAIQGTDLILLELPYMSYAPWMHEEIYHIATDHGLRVILAHIHRYASYNAQAQMERILEMDAILQVNNSAFGSLSQRRLIQKLIRRGRTVVFGSDAHDMAMRSPDWHQALRKGKAAWIQQSDAVFQQHCR